jgi:hypothetical protein
MNYLTEYICIQNCTWNFALEALGAKSNVHDMKILWQLCAVKHWILLRWSASLI